MVKENTSRHASTMRVDGVSTGVWAALNDDTPSYSTNTFNYPYSSPIAIRDTRSYTIQSTCPARVITQCSIATTSLTSQDKTIYRLQILGSEIPRYFKLIDCPSTALSPKREGAPRLTLTNIFGHSTQSLAAVPVVPSNACYGSQEQSVVSRWRKCRASL